MKVSRPRALSLISIMNAVAAVLHILFWSLAFIKLPSPRSFHTLEGTGLMAISYGFGFADLAFSFPLLAISAFGLWRLRFYGWFTAQLANVLWFYSFTVLLTKDFYTAKFSPGNILFLPFAVFSIWIAVYLWNHRSIFSFSS